MAAGSGADPVAVDWEVAEDEAFGRVVQRGTRGCASGVGAQRARGGVGP